MKRLSRIFSSPSTRSSVSGPVLEEDSGWRPILIQHSFFEEKFMTVDVPEALKIMKENKEFWPAVSGIWRDISVDFGRAHYTFPGLSMESAIAVHRFCYRKLDPVTDESRAAFFQSVGLTDPNAIAECDQVSPTRNRIIARVKYELVKRYIASAFPAWSEDQVAGAAVRAMYWSTQGPLGYIKTAARKIIEGKFGGESPPLSMFQSAIIASAQTGVQLRVTFCNYRPRSGPWQVSSLLKKYPRAIKIQFVMDATKTDRGQLSVMYKKHPQEEFSADEKASLYGIWVPDMAGPAPAMPAPAAAAAEPPPAADPKGKAAPDGKAATDAKKAVPYVIRYCDTSPTF